MLKMISVTVHPRINCRFSHVSKRGVSEIVSKSNTLTEVFVETEVSCNVSADVCDFEGVGETGPVMIVLSGDKDLCFSLQSSECLCG